MSCLDPQAPPTLPQIIIGEDKSITVQLLNASGTPPYFDLTTVTEIVAYFLNADGTYLQLKQSLSQIAVINAVSGTLQILLSAAQTALLKLSPILTPATSTAEAVVGASDIELHITIASKETIVQLPMSVQVVQTLFP